MFSYFLRRYSFLFYRGKILILIHIQSEGWQIIIEKDNIEQNDEKSPSQQKLSMDGDGNRAEQKKKLLKNEYGDYAFREKKSKCLSFCCTDLLNY